MSEIPHNTQVSDQSQNLHRVIGRGFWPVVLLSALVVCLGLRVVIVYAENTQPACLLIETLGKAELLDLQTFGSRTINPPALSDDPSVFQAYAPDGKSLATMRGTAASGLTVETLLQAYPVSTYSQTFNTFDNAPAVTFAWSPNSQWVAVEGYAATNYLSVMNVLNHEQHTIKLGPSSGGYFDMEWAAGSQFLITSTMNSQMLTLYHIPDLKSIDLGASDSRQIGACLDYYCWAVNATQRRAYAAQAPAGKPGAANLILLDAGVPDVQTIPIPQSGDGIVVGIAPDGAYVAVTDTGEQRGASGDDIAVSVPLWVYTFDNPQGVRVADIASTAYQGMGRMGGASYFPEIAWSRDSANLYYLAYADNNLSMQLWSYQLRTTQKQRLASWPRADSPYGYSFYISHDKQRFVLSADPHWQSTVQLVLPDGKIIKLMENGHSSDWSEDDHYIAVGHFDHNSGRLVVTVFDQNGAALGYTVMEDLKDDNFLLTWTGCRHS